jgi:hypothetical protein
LLAGEIGFETDTNKIKIGDGANDWDNLEYFSDLFGYSYVDTVQFTSSGTFSKATYPWLRAVRVICVGGGAGGGYAATTGANQNSHGIGGSGGARVSSFITDLSLLDSSVTVTRGSGGAGGIASSATNATDGEDTSFGTLVVAAGGARGLNGSAVTIPWILDGQASKIVSSSTGDFVERGNSGLDVYAVVAGRVITARGGSAPGYSPSTSGTVTNSGTNGAAAAAADRGNGGYGGANAQNQATARNGGSGANGIVFVELYA